MRASLQIRRHVGWAGRMAWQRWFPRLGTLTKAGQEGVLVRSFWRGKYELTRYSNGGAIDELSRGAFKVFFVRSSDAEEDKRKSFGPIFRCSMGHKRGL